MGVTQSSEVVTSSSSTTQKHSAYGEMMKKVADMERLRRQADEATKKVDAKRKQLQELQEALQQTTKVDKNL